jgi:predicted alpha/beta hydrolase family esterase
MHGVMLAGMKIALGPADAAAGLTTSRDCESASCIERAMVWASRADPTGQMSRAHELAHAAVSGFREGASGAHPAANCRPEVP